MHSIWSIYARICHFQVDMVHRDLTVHLSCTGIWNIRHIWLRRGSDWCRTYLWFRVIMKGKKARIFVSMYLLYRAKILTSYLYGPLLTSKYFFINNETFMIKWFCSTILYAVKKTNLVTEPFCNKKVTWIYFRDNFKT